MKLRTVASFGAIAAAVLLLPTAISAKTETIPYTKLGSIGDQAVGARTFRITQINAFRFKDVLITDKHTFTDPQDVIALITSTGNLTPSGVAGAGDKVKNLKKATDALQAQKDADTLHGRILVQFVSSQVDQAETAVLGAVKRVDQIRDCTDHRTSDVTELVQYADPATSEKDDAYAARIDGVLKGTAINTVTLPALQASLNTCLGTDIGWPTDLLERATNAVVAARAAGEDRSPAVKARLKNVEDQVTALQPQASNAIYGPIAKRYEALRTWRAELSKVKSIEQFQVEQQFPCSNRFKADSILISIVAYDRLESDPVKSKQTKEIRTVECPSALSATHGFGYSNIPLQSLKVGSAFVNGAAVSTIQNDRKDAGRPYLMSAIGHYEIWRGDPVSVHLSLAATTSQSAVVGGMVGLSLSFHRALYVTAGIFRSDVESLQNGYTVGQTVPSSLTLSTTKNAVNRFGMAISFPIIKGESGTSTTTRGTDQGTVNPGSNPPGQGGKGPGGQGGTPQSH